MLTQDQINDLKKQLSAQIEHLPEDKKQEALNQIENLDGEALEEMLEEQKANNRKNVFRMIVDGEIASRKVDEGKEAIIVLDIKPVTRGHMILIPKKEVHSIEKLPVSCFEHAKQIAKKIESSLKAKETRIETEKRWGEVVINIIPQYDSLITLESPRYEAKDAELDEVITSMMQAPKPEPPKKVEVIETKEVSTKIIKKRRVP